MRINHTIRTLITSDFLFNSGFSLFAPIFAVFVTEQVSGGNVAVVGFAAALTQLVKAAVQVPVARYLDRNHGEYDDFIAMVTGSLVNASVPFMYLLVSEVWHIYLVQAIFGIGLGLAVPPWFAIFTRHIDKTRENVEWSAESIAIGISGAAAAAAGGLLAETYGFSAVFMIAGFFSLLGVAMQIRIWNDLKPHVGRGQVQPAPDRAG